MSVEITGKVWSQSQAKGTARLVLLAIADHANPSGVCWPSLRRLSSYVNVDRRNVIKAINSLVKMGELERIDNGFTGRATTYKVTLGSDAPVTRDESVTSDATVTPPVTEASPQPSLNRKTFIKGKPNFEEFWTQYPRKVGKGAARTAYDKAIKKIGHEELMLGLSKYHPDPEYICNPSTWLNQERWHDEPTHNNRRTTRRDGRQGTGELAGAFERFRTRRKDHG